MKWIQSNIFTLLLILAVCLGLVLPEGGMRGGWLRSELTIRVGITLLFLIQGLALPTRLLGMGVFNWRLHVFVQGANFLGSPALAGVMMLVFRPLLAPEAWSGFWYLAVLPTTVSSAVALTTVARGDAVGAVFNTTLANILAVFVVPLWVLLLFDPVAGSGQTSLGPLLWDLFKLILLPLGVGQVLRPLMAPTEVFRKAKPAFKWFGNAVILFIVYATFSNSMVDGTWSRFGLPLVVTVTVLVSIYVGLMAGLSWWGSRFAGEDVSVRIAAFYCASQKSLATGLPMANAIFAGASAAGQVDFSLLVLPLLICHPMQLLLGGYLAARFGKRPEGLNE